MRRRAVTPRRVLAELADIAFADLRQSDLPVKAGDKLRALELIYKYLGMGESAGPDEGVVIVDEVADIAAAPAGAPCGERGEGASGYG